MKTATFFFLLFLVLGACAQEKRFAFTPAVQFGMLEGENGTAFQLKAISGVQHKSWTAGVGAGLDYYHTRSIPVFLDLRNAFGKGDKKPFVYINGGYHFPWLEGWQKDQSGVTANGGLYFDAGIGYQIQASKKTQVFFTLGYSQKNFTEKQSYPMWIDIWPSVPPQQQTIDYKLRRLSIQTGFRF